MIYIKPITGTFNQSKSVALFITSSVVSVIAITVAIITGVSVSIYLRKKHQQHDVGGIRQWNT